MIHTMTNYIVFDYVIFTNVQNTIKNYNSFIFELNYLKENVFTNSDCSLKCNNFNYRQIPEKTIFKYR